MEESCFEGIKELLSLPPDSVGLDVAISFDFGGWQKVARLVFAEVEALRTANSALTAERDALREEVELYKQHLREAWAACGKYEGRAISAESRLATARQEALDEAARVFEAAINSDSPLRFTSAGSLDDAADYEGVLKEALEQLSALSGNETREVDK